jgi:Tfp pilus assembly protein FimV
MSRSSPPSAAPEQAAQEQGAVQLEQVARAGAEQLEQLQARSQQQAEEQARTTAEMMAAADAVEAIRPRPEAGGSAAFRRRRANLRLLRNRAGATGKHVCVPSASRNPAWVRDSCGGRSAP